MTTDKSNRQLTRLDALNFEQLKTAARSLFIRRARLTPFAAARIVEVR